MSVPDEGSFFFTMSVPDEGNSRKNVVHTELDIDSGVVFFFKNIDTGFFLFFVFFFRTLPYICGCLTLLST